jgi:ATP-binding cassette subfamily F protein uup
MNLLSVNNVSKLMNEGPLFEEVTLGIDEGEKIGFIGRNGCGKSTFLRLLKGETEPDSGTISRNKDLVIGSLEQRVNLKPETSLRDYLFESGDPAVLLAKEYHETLINLHERKEYQDKITELEARMERENGFAVEHAYRSFCTELGLPAEDTPMENLSGGMMRKASIARCLAMGANLLILDEPTNHVDLDTVLWLEEKLKKTRQAFILVTHDRAFLDAVCTRIMEIVSNHRI